MKLDSKIPQGPLAEKWTNYKSKQNLVNPANKRKIDIIVVGTGLAGAAAAVQGDGARGLAGVSVHRDREGEKGVGGGEGRMALLLAGGGEEGGPLAGAGSRVQDQLRSPPRGILVPGDLDRMAEGLVVDDEVAILDLDAQAQRDDSLD